VSWEMHLQAEIELNSEMHLEAEIELNTGIHLEAMIERVWKCIWRPRSIN